MRGASSPITASEAVSLFASFANEPALVLAVSGGPDSTALLYLVAQWRKTLRMGPKLIAVTVDHGLRKESAAEARAVKRIAKEFGVEHLTKRWLGTKPSTGIPAAARDARYALLAQVTKAAKATHILTAHTQDDQAETVLMRIGKGSGVTGLAGMAWRTPRGGFILARPLLGISKARLIATLDQASVSYITDPTNDDPAYLRPRLRKLMPSLAAEGIDARGLSRFAARMARADAALEAMAEAADTGDDYEASGFHRLPQEVRIRLLLRAIARNGRESPAGLAQVELLAVAIDIAASDGTTLRRTLAGALITLSRGRLTITPAPPRRIKGR